MKPRAVAQRIPRAAAPSNIAADRLATWAFAELTKGAGGEYPLQKVLCGLQPGDQGNFHPDGTLQTNASPPKVPRKFKPVPEPIKIQRELKAISAQLRKDAAFVTRYISYSIWANHLAEAIDRLTMLLMDLAGKDARAAELLFLIAHDSVVGLENLEMSADSLRLVQAVASKQPIWPVLYSPLPRNKRTLDKAMKKLGLAEHNFQKLNGARWAEKSLAGKFAHRIGFTLQKIHFDRALRVCLSGANVMPTQKWEARLVAQGWPRWIVKLHQLPELTQASAPAWFEVGWEALKEATGGDVASNSELIKLGKSSADYGRSMAITKRGQLGKQTSRVETQIHRELKKAFLVRFGNPV